MASEVGIFVEDSRVSFTTFSMYRVRKWPRTKHTLFKYALFYLFIFDPAKLVK